MASSRRDRERKPGRRTPFREPKPVILVVCEGAKSEPQYLEGFRVACHNPRVDIQVAPEHGVPKTLVENAKRRMREAAARAQRQKDDNLSYDSVWCVFDIDDHPNLGDAKQMARDNEISLAISNPCFELWLLLHFRDCPGMQHRDRIVEMLCGYVGEYDKSIEFAKYWPHHPLAVKRARKMDELAEQINDPGRNPTTGVYRLLEVIQGEG